MSVFRLTEHFPRISEILSTEVVGKKDLICRAAFASDSVPLYSNIKDLKNILPGCMLYSEVIREFNCMYIV